MARELGLPQYTYLESWIRCITVLRNCCAHHARIWNRRFALKPQLPNRLPLQWITPSQKPIKLYHQLCTLLYLEQTITPCMDLKSSLFKLFAEYPNVDLHAMGFPQDWETNHYGDCRQASPACKDLPSFTSLPTYSILITTSPLRLSTLLTRSKSWRKVSWLLRTKPGA